MKFHNHLSSWQFTIGCLQLAVVVTQLCLILCDSVDCSNASLPCPSPSPRACSNSRPVSRWWNPTISSSVIPFSSCLQSFPASESFPMSQFFTSGGQNIGVSASASVLLMNIQDWFPLVLTGLISSKSKDSSPAPQLKIINSAVIFLFYGLTLTSIHDCWKSHSFDYMDLCQQNDVSAL